MWQQLLVLLLVAASAAYAAWSLSPPAVHWRLRSRLDAAFAGAPGPLAAAARRLLRQAAPPAVGGCAACPASAVHRPRSLRG